MKCRLPLKTMAAAIALTALPMTAAAICPHTSVKGLDGKCLDGRCPPGSTAYMATIENSFPDQLYITYAFRRPDNAIITAGLALKPGVSRLPLGFGPNILPADEPHNRRLGRLRILECGVDPAIKYKWRRK